MRLLGQVIGNFNRIDYNIESATRGKFTRIAVEVALDKPLCSQFLLDGKIQQVKYESLPIICFECGTYGQLNSSCPEKITNEVTENDKYNSLDRMEEVEATVQSANHKFGPWMVVAEKGNHRTHK